MHFIKTQAFAANFSSNSRKQILTTSFAIWLCFLGCSRDQSGGQSKISESKNVVRQSEKKSTEPSAIQQETRIFHDRAVSLLLAHWAIHATLSRAIVQDVVFENYDAAQIVANSVPIISVYGQADSDTCYARFSALRNEYEELAALGTASWKGSEESNFKRMTKAGVAHRIFAKTIVGIDKEWALLVVKLGDDFAMEPLGSSATPITDSVATNILRAEDLAAKAATKDGVHIWLRNLVDSYSARDKTFVQALHDVEFAMNSRMLGQSSAVAVSMKRLQAARSEVGGEELSRVRDLIEEVLKEEPEFALTIQQALIDDARLASAALCDLRQKSLGSDER